MNASHRRALTLARRRRARLVRFGDWRPLEYRAYRGGYLPYRAPAWPGKLLRFLAGLALCLLLYAAVSGAIWLAGVVADRIGG